MSCRRLSHLRSRVIRSRICAVSIALALSTSACGRDAEFAGRSADDWAQLLKSSRVRDRVDAANAFLQVGPHQHVHVWPLLLAASDPDSSVRVAAIDAIAHLPRESSKALITALGDSDVRLRRAAARGLGHISNDGKSGVRALERALEDSDNSVRTFAVLSLGDRATDAHGLENRIREMATQPGPQRAAALTVLPNIDTESQSLLNVYLPAISDTSSAVRAAAALMLITAAPEDEAVAILSKMLSDSDRQVRLSAMSSLAIVANHNPTAYAAINNARQSTDSTTKRKADSTLNAVRPR